MKITPMKAAGWWPVAVFLGLAVLGTDGRPNKDGFGSPPDRPVDGIPESLRVKGLMGHNGYPGPCEHKYCGLGRHCVVNRETDQGECRCLDRCKPHYKPVCGSDGKLYQNHCELHRTSCIQGHRITIMHSEECFYKGRGAAADSARSRSEVAALTAPQSHYGESRNTREDPDPRNAHRRLQNFLPTSTAAVGSLIVQLEHLAAPR
ncbi:unnamed protein product [Menidia menidia]|uniref:(Atlantic silverside) hypothetical protein n=1 Tax=Menidia menidia TaxID=238744 RepID=A0A8S4BSR4_9TELE|nr:unnamed protein product [Menidia menidia]